MPSLPVIGGDATAACIAAASVLAKVHRDRIMRRLDADLPGYGFAVHKGYNTSAHTDALGRLGPCDHHRRSWANVAGLTAEPAERTTSAGRWHSRVVDAG